MSDTEWMESEAYSLADRIEEDLRKAYKQGIVDAWTTARRLWNTGMLSFEWTADEMMAKAEQNDKYSKALEALAQEMGVHKLYEAVRNMHEKEEEAKE